MEASRYVQKYTRKPSTQVKDEFFISTDDVNQVNHYKEKIEKMHQIKISFENKIEEGQWLILEGEPVDRKNAKFYITAICNPAEKKQVQFSTSSCSELTDPETLEYIEKTTNAFIRPLKKIAQFEISGTDLAVTLALSQIEELAGTALIGNNIGQFDDDDDNDNDVITISPVTNKASNRLTTVLERALSANSDGICSADDYRKVPQAVKRVLVNCLQDDDQDEIDDDLLFADGKKDSSDTGSDIKGSKIMMFYEGDDKPEIVEEKKTVQTSPGVSTIAEKVTELTVSNPNNTTLHTKQQKYLRDFGMSVGFKETEVNKALCFVHEKTRPSDFLDMLNSLQNQEGTDHENDSDDDVIILETETVDLVTDERVVVDETRKGKGKVSNDGKEGDTGRPPEGQGQKSLPDGYRERLIQDFFTEDENCSVDELKKRNAERQKLLRENFESHQKNLANQSNVQGQTGIKPNKKPRKRGKKNKQQQQQQQQKVENKQEKEGMHDKQFRLDNERNETVSRDDEETCVLRVWSKDQGATGTTEEPFQTTPKRKGKINQQQWPQHASGNQNQQSQGLPVFQSGNQYGGPVGRGVKPTQVVTPVHAPVGDLMKMAPQAMGGPVGEDLRYIVIDGSNVAMTHGNGKHFSCKGIKICVDYFRQRGHKNITVFVPQWRQYQPSDTNMILDQNILYDLKTEDILVFTPSRKIGRRLVVAYDDRFVLELAEAEDGIIVSNDQYRDLMNEKAGWRKLIEERLLMYSFVRDRFMPPNDPLGREGPCLDDYLRVPKVPPFQRFRHGYGNPHQQQHYQQQPHYLHQQPNQPYPQQNPHYPPFQSQQNYQQQYPPASGHGHVQQGQGQLKPGQGHSQQGQGNTQIPSLFEVGVFQGGKGTFAKAVNQGQHHNENTQAFQKQGNGARNKTQAQKQYDAQHVNETENGTQGAKQGKGQLKNPIPKGQWSLKGKGNPRSDEETEELFKELRIMFPDDDQEEKVRSVLTNHDRERDLTKLTNYLMSILF